MSEAKFKLKKSYMSAQPFTHSVEDLDEAESNKKPHTMAQFNIALTGMERPCLPR